MKLRPFAFVLFARAPRRGRVKTRMRPCLGADEALALHEAMIADSLDLLREASAAAGAAPCLAVSDPVTAIGDRSGHPLFRALDDLDLLPQRGGDLGERLRHTCDDLFERGHPGVIIIGSDSPHLPPDRLMQAQAALRSGADAVVGPAEDGGYYLIGVARSMPALFEGIAWGTDSVCADTMAAAQRIGARADLLPHWYDIDRPEDLARLRREPPLIGGRAARTMAIASTLFGAGRLGPR